MTVPSSQPDPTQAAASSGGFVNTRWTLIAAARHGGSAEAAQALETLCRTYWYPLYAFVRRKGFGEADAEDLTQGFFAQLLQRNFTDVVDPAKGRFRSFLLASLNYYLANHRAAERAQKRGGGVPVLSLDEEPSEIRFQREPVSPDSPEKTFDRHWAETLLRQAKVRLEADYHGHRKAALFERLSPFLQEDGDASRYRQEAKVLGTTPGAVGVAVHRLRQRYRDMIYAEVSRTVADSKDAEAEYRHLQQVLARG